jgi:hypothetical protein
VKIVRHIFVGAPMGVTLRRALYVFQGKVLEKIDKKTEAKITKAKSLH